MRTITVWVPQMILRMTLWEHSANEEMFEIRNLTRKPYVNAYGEKIYLTDKETRYARDLKRAVKNMDFGEARK